jgi:hypothetical protein
VYIRLNRQTVLSADGKTPWVTEAWYTMNNIPAESGLVSQR